jgi:aconitate hydratase
MADQNQYATFNPRVTLTQGTRNFTVYSVKALEQLGFGPIERYPYALRILLENLLRHHPQGLVSDADINNLASWRPGAISSKAVPFMPARVILQDFTGVPPWSIWQRCVPPWPGTAAIPATMNPFIPVDLVIDHSIQVDRSADSEALAVNVGLEMARNRERYTMLHWGQRAFRISGWCRRAAASSTR